MEFGDIWRYLDNPMMNKLGVIWGHEILHPLGAMNSMWFSALHVCTFVPGLIHESDHFIAFPLIRWSSFSVSSSLALLGNVHPANLLGTDGVEMWGASAHHIMHHAHQCLSFLSFLGIVVSDVQEQHQTMEERFQECLART